MVAVAALEWQDVMDGNFSEQSTRTAWRAAVAIVAARAKQALPEANGRIDAAVKMVLAGDVELQPNGTAKVASQSNGQTVYHVVNGECSCKDYPKAPQSMCKHRMAYGIHKRAKTLVTQRLEQLDGNGNGQQTKEAPQAEASATPQHAPRAMNERVDDARVVSQDTRGTMGLPEAPASANVYVMLAGRKVQMTLRDCDEGRLLARLEALLQRFPNMEEQDEQAPPEGWCSKHGVQMKLRNGEHGSWYSHKTDQGWCKGK